jgi:glycosyltransferase involved in cell wall biosynthesis
LSITQTLESANMRAMILERDEGLEGASIVIPCFNQRAFLKKALSSCLAQTVQPAEIIVVDDGSTEDICALAESFESPLIRCIRVANRGLPGARNTGLMNARGRAFLPLDADDWIEPTYLEKTLPLIDTFDVICTGLKEFGERRGKYMPGIELGMDGLTLEAERTSNRLFYCSLFRTALLRKVGGYNSRMIHGYEDWDLWVDLMQRGARITAVNEVLFHYNTRSDGMLADTERNWREWCLDEMARHHGYTR